MKKKVDLKKTTKMLISKKGESAIFAVFVNLNVLEFFLSAD